MAIVESRSRRVHVDDARVTWLVRGALGWTVLMAPFVLLAPTGTMESATSRSDDTSTSGTASGDDLSLLTSEGWGVALVLVVPVLLSLVAVLWGQRSRTALVVPALVYDLGVVLSILSVGIFFAPAALALTVAALARRD